MTPVALTRHEHTSRRWRYRAALEEKAVQRLQKNRMQKNTAEFHSFERYTAAVGADRYLVTCIKIEADSGYFFLYQSAA